MYGLFGPISFIVLHIYILTSFRAIIRCLPLPLSRSLPSALLLRPPYFILPFRVLILCPSSSSFFSTHSKQHNAAFLKVDIDEADDVAQAFAIRSMPTFVFLRPKDGLEEEIRFSGANKPKLEGLVRAICAAVVNDGTEKKEEDKKSK